MSAPQDAARPGPLARSVMMVAWPAFLAACLLELLVFSMVDPLDLQLSGWSRQGIYTAAFFVFWAVCMGSNAITALLAGPEDLPAR